MKLHGGAVTKMGWILPCWKRAFAMGEKKRIDSVQKTFVILFLRAQDQNGVPFPRFVQKTWSKATPWTDMNSIITAHTWSVQKSQFKSSHSRSSSFCAILILLLLSFPLVLSSLNTSRDYYATKRDLQCCAFDLDSHESSSPTPPHTPFSLISALYTPSC